MTADQWRAEQTYVLMALRSAGTPGFIAGTDTGKFIRLRMPGTFKVLIY